MASFNAFVAIILLCLGQIASTLPLPNILPALPHGDPMVRRDNAAAPIPRVHIVSPESLQAFTGLMVPPSKNGASLKARGNIGDDNRFEWNDGKYPHGAIGVVDFGTGRCSGSLIGPRHVVTAAHCVSSTPGATRFEPDYFDGERANSSDVVDIIMMEKADFGDCGRMDDWAIFILADYLGDKYGYLGAKEIDCVTQKDKQLFTHAGYPGDKGTVRPFQQQGISVTRCDACQKSGILMTDADAFGGQSGGPLYRIEEGLAWQYAVMSWTSSSGSGFASGSNFVNAVAKTRKDYP